MSGGATALRLGLALAAAGIVLATPVLILPAAALVLLVAACSAWARLSIRGVSARRIGVPARVTEGETFELVLVGTSGALPLIARIEDGAATESPTLRLLRPRSRFEVRLEGSFARRGRHLLEAPVLRAADPLGIASTTVPAGDPGSILVLPRIEPVSRSRPVDGPALGTGSRGLGEIAAGGTRESPADPELDGIRSYRPGTKATRIYWPALARGAGLAERHIVAAGDAAPLIALDPSAAMSERDLDAAARAAASLVVHLVRFGGCDLLVGGSGRRIAAGRDPRGWTEALAALALVGPDDGPPRLAPGDLRASVVWVAASRSPRPPPGAVSGFVLSPERLAGRTPELTVAGLSGYSLGRREAARVAA